ncbi:MAG: aminotransferase class I/II-fold pyridoxal phosphate-dependent enzyme [Sporomusaceae bacterium]|nr:aminotransferase class I/II-fold pyridoxal phosphate-dependent enzyme [Sporomusaceae bacterium]
MNWSNRISPVVNQVAPSGLRKFFDIAATMENVISLGVGEPDFATPKHIIDACVTSLQAGQTSYTSNSGLPELRQEIANHISSCCQVDYDPENQIIVTVGVSEALDLAIRTIVAPGDEVLIPEPCYVAYQACVTFAGGVPVPIATNPSRGFCVTAEELEEKITTKTKAIILGYPNNPTGAIMPQAELSRIAALVEKHDLLVISDELYSELTYEGSHVCFAALPGMKDRTILLNGFSKSHAMTGLRIGYALGNEDFIGAMVKIHQYTMLCAPVTAQIAALEALKNGYKEMRKMIDQYNVRRQLMYKGLTEMGLSCFEPQGAFYIFPSIQKTGLSSQEFCERLLQEERLAVIPGDAFGACGEGFIRCSYSYSTEHLQEALNRLERFVSRF